MSRSQDLEVPVCEILLVAYLVVLFYTGDVVDVSPFVTSSGPWSWVGWSSFVFFFCI